MFGLYRLVLAVAVALSHNGLILHRFNPGQWAVICFYVLSGFLMERQYHKLAPRGGVRAFYLDRFLRIFPVYCTVVVLCALIRPVSWIDLLINFSLLPLNYSEFTHVPILVDPAWSLACEVHFYLVVPLLVALPTATLRVFLGLSLLLFSVAICLPQHTFWTYTGFPGVLFTFLSGILINRRDWKTLFAAYGIVAALLTLFLFSKVFARGWQTGININVCCGYLIAIPATAYLSRLSPRVVWDQTVGLLSYPLFLVHMWVLRLCQAHLGLTNDVTFITISLLVAALLVVLVEKPFDLIRYRVRGASPASKI